MQLPGEVLLFTEVADEWVGRIYQTARGDYRVEVVDDDEDVLCQCANIGIFAAAKEKMRDEIVWCRENL